jgi:glycosyltransferase involved in cell wall biosynthesis
MHLPKISIITPSFNQGQFIGQTISSILDQGYPNLEYIVIDGGSTDNTVEVIKSFGGRITYWVSEPDRGQAHAINKGLERVTGDIVNWINSDDYLEPGSLMAIAKAWMSKPGTAVVCGYTRCFWHDSGATSHTYRMGLRKSVASTILNIEMNQPGTFYAADAVKSLGGINESLRYVFDNELWMRYLCKYGLKNIVMADGLIAHFRQHGESKSFGEGFHLFALEQAMIVAHLVKLTGLPQYLAGFYAGSESKPGYLPGEWDLSSLETYRFNGWFANRHMVTLYNSGHAKEAAASLKLAVKSGEFTFERKNLALIKNILFSR